MKTRKQRKQDRQANHEETAMHAMFWTLTCVLFIGLAATLFYGCGADPQAAGPQTWTVNVGNADIVAQQRTWEVCGGQAAQLTVSSFRGTGADAVLSCYRQYGDYQSITTPLEAYK